LAVGGAIAGLAGALWAWLNSGIFPDFLNPVRSTFLVWAAFIVGGRGNNRGMIIGSFIIVITEFVFNVMVVARGNSDLAFHDIVANIDQVFSWVVVDIGGFIWSDLSISQTFPTGNVIAELAYIKLGLIGLVILVSLMLAEKGLVPEVPLRPTRPDMKSDNPLLANKNKSENKDNEEQSPQDPDEVLDEQDNESENSSQPEIEDEDGQSPKNPKKKAKKSSRQGSDGK